ncbi:MAG: ATP-binding protein [Thermoanaerobaculia bacterium]
MNLAVNARDAMPTGGTLALSAKNVEIDQNYAGMVSGAAPGSYVEIDVEDTGPGIPPEILDKIFEPFFTTKEIGKGTGLGLSTSLAIVRSHGGFMRVYNDPGRGSRFTVYLPSVRSRATDSSLPGETELPAGRGELILVVDDEIAVREVTQQTLEAFGYRALVAADGAEAISLYAKVQGRIRLVIIDMMMPVMDGPATIRVLRKINPALAIIGTSGLAAGENVATAKSLGIQTLLSKPYSAATLLQTLSAILAESS